MNHAIPVRLTLPPAQERGTGVVTLSALGVGLFLAEPMASRMARTEGQICRLAARYPHLADALCRAWDMWSCARTPTRIEMTPVRASARPNMEPRNV